MIGKYASDPAWADVTPLLQDDGPNPIVSISYNENFVELMNYFRAILFADEMSERAWSLTAHALEYNAANYTIWVFRRKLLQSLQKDLASELIFTRTFALRNPKNYQIWHHRREVVTLLNDGSLELGFTALALREDAKNYHAWAHRQWALRTFQLWSGELAFLDSLLAQDVRNNSAWNQRWFVLCHTKSVSTQEDMEFCLAKIRTAVNNESPWNYLRALYQTKPDMDWVFLEAQCQLLHDLSPTCVFLQSCLLDIYQHQEKWSKCKEQLALLSTELDVMRRSYYSHRGLEIQKAEDKLD